MSGENILSEREQEILQLVAEGLTNREIAQKLSISHNTVKVHLSNIFEKAGVSSRTEATLYAIQQRIVDVPGGEEESQMAWSDGSNLIQQFRWVWLAVVALIILIGISLGMNLSAQEETPVAMVPTADVAERWEALPSLPLSKTAMAFTAYSDEIFSIGGLGAEGVVGDVYRFDLTAGVWSVAATKPTPVSEVEAALIGEKIYVPGGFTSDGTATAVLEIYDPRLDLWMTGAALPVPLANYALADFEGLLYLFGGTDGKDTKDTVWIYDPEEDAWQPGTPMKVAREGAAAVALTDRIVVLGGRNGSRLLKITQSYVPSRDASGENPWEDFVDMPQGRVDFGAASIYDLVYLLGGEMDGEGETGLILVEDNWVSLPVEQDYSGSQTQLLSIGQLLYVLAMPTGMTDTEFWSYQAFYYSIYIPIMP
ncbi:MAG: helix-turn-helix domain-containing protein [Anaerolineaceae bacterium]|nr:helix-turn-helix domain-containing protein [Anaerolineaceae bacterium]